MAQKMEISDCLVDKYKKLLYQRGLILDPYCVRYLHTMPFLNFLWYFLTPKTLSLHAILGGFHLQNALNLLNYALFIFLVIAQICPTILKYASP